MPEANIWYCGKCRKPLRVQPKHAIPKSCKCRVPQIPRYSTRVTW